jgi:hypothetical protein
MNRPERAKHLDYLEGRGSTNQSACFHPIKNVYRDKTVLLLCHLSKLIKIACYSCQIFKLFLIIVFLITVLYSILKYKWILVFKTRATFRAGRRSRSVRNRASVLKTSYPRILYDIFF